MTSFRLSKVLPRSVQLPMAQMVEGLKNAEIVGRLVVNQSTVNYISNILMKLGVDNHVAAVAPVIQKKLIWRCQASHPLGCRRRTEQTAQILNYRLEEWAVRIK